MYARVPKPKLSLKITPPSGGNPALKSPGPSLNMPRSPLSNGMLSPTAANTARNAKMSKEALSPLQQQPSFAYSSSSSTAGSKTGILKKNGSSYCDSRGPSKKIQFHGEPVVHPITPIEYTEDYYTPYVKMSKDERRWSRLSQS